MAIVIQRILSEKQFLHFSTDITSMECRGVAPFVRRRGISFFLESTNEMMTIRNISAVSIDGQEEYHDILGASSFKYNDTNKKVNINVAGTLIGLPNYSCFRIKLTIARYIGGGLESVHYYYSNIMKEVGDDVNFSTIEYWCNEEQFGIPFVLENERCTCRVTIPLILNNPQFKTKDEVYQKLSGENVVLYSLYNKEYEAQTEYVNQEWHDAMALALACDHIEVNGVAMYKSSDYSIDWEKKTESECGEKIARATFKMQENFNNRNSN